MTKQRRLRLFAEMAALYIALPLAILFAVEWTRISLIMMLVPALALVILILSLDKSFSWRTLLAIGISRRHLVQILALFAAIGGALTLCVYLWMPESFLSLPRYRPGLWLALMLLYPLISVTAQEIAYRVLFAHRYAVLFAGQMLPAIVVNAALFTFGHIYFGSWVTLVVSFAGGLIFAYRYLQTGSFWAVVLEHSLYGMLIFTIGLGRYFFTGVPFV